MSEPTDVNKHTDVLAGISVTEQWKVDLLNTLDSLVRDLGDIDDKSEHLGFDKICIEAKLEDEKSYLLTIKSIGPHDVVEITKAKIYVRPIVLSDVIYLNKETSDVKLKHASGKNRENCLLTFADGDKEFTIAIPKNTLFEKQIDTPYGKGSYSAYGVDPIFDPNKMEVLDRSYERFGKPIDIEEIKKIHVNSVLGNNKSKLDDLKDIEVVMLKEIPQTTSFEIYQVNELKKAIAKYLIQIK